MKNILLLIITISLFSCSPSSGNDDKKSDEKTYTQLIADAWKSFKSKNYDDAIKFFKQAKEKDSRKADAYAGLGWAYFLKKDFSDSKSSFNSASLKNNDINAGLAFLHLAMRNYDDCIIYTQKLIKADPNWKFSNGLTVSSREIYIIESQAYYQKGNYQKSLESFKNVKSTFNANITVYQGRLALAQAIQELNTGISFIPVAL